APSRTSWLASRSPSSTPSTSPAPPSHPLDALTTGHQLPSSSSNSHDTATDITNPGQQCAFARMTVKRLFRTDPSPQQDHTHGRRRLPEVDLELPYHRAVRTGAHPQPAGRLPLARHGAAVAGHRSGAR